MDKNTLLQARLAEEARRHAEETAKIKAAVDAEWQSYYNELETLNTAEQVAMRSVKTGFDDLRRQLDQKYGKVDAPAADSNIASATRLDDAVAELSRI